MRVKTKLMEKWRSGWLVVEISKRGLNEGKSDFLWKCWSELEEKVAGE